MRLRRQLATASLSLCPAAMNAVRGQPQCVDMTVHTSRLGKISSPDERMEESLPLPDDSSCYISAC